MNQNLSLKIEFNTKTLRQLVPVLTKVQPYFYGLLLVGIFAYTAFLINQSLNVQPNSSQTVIKPLKKISFDKKTIDSLKSLQPVGGDVPLGTLGTGDPFK